MGESVVFEPRSLIPSSLLGQGGINFTSNHGWKTHGILFVQLPAMELSS